MTVILCNGKFPEHPYPLQLLSAAERVVCCDGAAVKLLAYGKEPYAIVGDLDSLPADVHRRFSDRVFHYPCQEANDQTKAVQWCAEQKIEEVVVLGATGLRDDHALGNVSLLVEYAPYIKVSMVTDTGVFIPVLKSACFDSQIGQQISIFATTPDTRITTRRLKFDVTDRLFSNWYQGTLNEALDTSFDLSFDQGKLILFFSYHEGEMRNEK